MSDTCTRCGAGVRPVVTEGGLYRELDLDPVETGNHVILDVGGRTRARVLTGASGGPDGRPAYRVHQCPPPPPPGPLCGFCHLPMPREIAHQLNWSTHPSCDPEMQDELQRLALQRRQAQARARRRR